MSKKDEQIDGLIKRLDIAGNSIQQLESVNRELVSKVMLLTAEKTKWEADKLNQNTIIQTALGTANQNNNRYLEEISRLKEEIRELKTKLLIKEN